MFDIINLIKPFLIIVPLYLGLNIYNGKYNNFLSLILLKKIKMGLYLENNFYKSNKEEKENIIKNYFVFYNNKSIVYSSLENVPEELNKFPLKFYVKENNDIKEIYRFTNNEFDINNLPKRIEQPFIQVEIKNKNDNIIFENEHIKSIFFENNEVFDFEFLNWFLDFYEYDIILDENYELKIIDKNINCFSLSKKEKIILNNEESGYKVTNILDNLDKFENSKKI